MKYNAYNKLLMLMRTGEIIKIEDFVKHFDNNGDERMYRAMYRLSAYMCDLKTHMKAIIKSHKDGREVVGYQLINYKDYDENGRYTKIS